MRNPILEGLFIGLSVAGFFSILDEVNQGFQERKCERTYNVYDCAQDTRFYPIIDGEMVYTQEVNTPLQ